MPDRDPLTVPAEELAEAMVREVRRGDGVGADGVLPIATS